MRIVIWHYDPYPTAPGVYLEEFPKRGHQVTWVTTESGHPPGVRRWREGTVDHIEIVRRRDSRLPRPLSLLANRWGKLVAFGRKVRVMRDLARRRPDVLQARELVAEGLLAWIFARL